MARSGYPNLQVALQWIIAALVIIQTFVTNRAMSGAAEALEEGGGPLVLTGQIGADLHISFGGGGGHNARILPCDSVLRKTRLPFTVAQCSLKLLVETSISMTIARSVDSRFIVFVRSSSGVFSGVLRRRSEVASTPLLTFGSGLSATSEHISGTPRVLAPGSRSIYAHSVLSRCHSLLQRYRFLLAHCVRDGFLHLFMPVFNPNPDRKHGDRLMFCHSDFPSLIDCLDWRYGRWNDAGASGRNGCGGFSKIPDIHTTFATFSHNLLTYFHLI